MQASHTADTSARLAIMHHASEADEVWTMGLYAGVGIIYAEDVGFLERCGSWYTLNEYQRTELAEEKTAAELVG